jgi:hypothetical protein
MSLIIAETIAEQPITKELLKDADERIFPCFTARNVTWRYSLLSLDSHRMICTFDAPDAESVRDAYRRAGLPPRPVWTGDLIQLTAQPQRSSTLRHVIEGTYPPLSEADWNEISHKLLHYCAECEIEWLQSYLSLDRTRVIYELNAADIQPIQANLNQFGISCDRIWSAEILSPATVELTQPA